MIGIRSTDISDFILKCIVSDITLIIAINKSIYGYLNY